MTSPGDAPALLIAAQSGRALAAAARRAGFVPLVADLFGDLDTLDLAADHRSLRGRFGDGPSEGDVLPALESLAAAWTGELAGLVLGSGFESAPRLVAALARRYPLLGASAEAVERLKDPFAFAALLARLGVPHPEVAETPLAGRGAWLSKLKGGSGGGHIRVAGPRRRPRRYAQRCVSGVPHAAAFLADGREAQIVGFTEQWTAPSRHAPWRYGGAVEPGHLPPSVAQAVEAAIGGIVEAVGLRGLSSADLLVDGEDWWLLEVNPRPGATLDVLDRRSTPLLGRHVAASAGQLGALEGRPAIAAGSMIVYAPRRVACVPRLAWPEHVADRPAPGTAIKAGAPICTLGATGRDAAEVRSRLARRAEATWEALRAGNTDGEWHPDTAERQCPGGAAG